MLSFSATGMPCRGPRTCPRARSRSRRSASANASGFTASAACRTGSYVPIRARYWRTSSREVTRPDAMAFCMSLMLASTTEKPCGSATRRAGAGLDWAAARIEKRTGTRRAAAIRCTDFMTPHHRTWPVAGLLFASGFCALVYQIGWLREFRLIFGASTAASAAVLAIFMGGLGVGGWLLGRRADTHTRPLALYAQLEGIVALSAAASPLLLALVRRLYVVVGGTPRLGMTGGTIVRLILSALVLALPTIAMGGTLPAAARAITGAGDQRRRQLATLYGCNTLGAVTGCLVATFVALELFGTRSTLWLAAAINLLVAVVARGMDRTLEPVSDVEEPRRTVLDAQAPVGFVLTASAVVGFAFFLMELVWDRMLGPLLGGSVFTFGLILGVALLGIGLGGLVYALIGVDRPATLRAFALTCLLEAVAI